MKIKNKHIFVDGIRHRVISEKQGLLSKIKFECIASNDEYGKTISISDGETQFTIPFEPLEKYLK